MQQEIDIEEVVNVYGLELWDLTSLGRPASKPIRERKYDRKQVRYLASLKQSFKTDLRKEKQAQRLEKKKQAQRSDELSKYFQKLQLKKKEADELASQTLFQNGQKMKNRETAPKTDAGLIYDVWYKIMEWLCHDIEPNGIRAASVIARDLVNMSVVNKELFTISKSAFKFLSTLCVPISKSVSCLAQRFPRQRKHQSHQSSVEPEESLWDAFISDPASLTQPQLDCLCVVARCPRSGNNSNKTLGLMRKIGLKAPTKAPARLVLAVQQEKSQPAPFATLCSSLIMESGKQLQETFGTRAATAFFLRRTCVERGLHTLNALIEETSERVESSASIEHEIVESSVSTEHEMEEYDSAEDEGTAWVWIIYMYELELLLVLCLLDQFQGLLDTLDMRLNIMTLLQLQASLDLAFLFTSVTSKQS